MVRHDTLNTDPQFITTVVHIVLEMATEVKATFPGIQVYISSLLPRVPSRNFTALKTTQYNRLAKRFGEHLVTKQNSLDFSYLAILNNYFWIKVYKGIARSALYARDGLHATDGGREFLAESWMGAMCSN